MLTLLRVVWDVSVKYWKIVLKLIPSYQELKNAKNDIITYFSSFAFSVSSVLQFLGLIILILFLSFFVWILLLLLCIFLHACILFICFSVDFMSHSNVMHFCKFQPKAACEY